MTRRIVILHRVFGVPDLRFLRYGQRVALIRECSDRRKADRAAIFIALIAIISATGVGILVGNRFGRSIAVSVAIATNALVFAMGGRTWIVSQMKDKLLSLGRCPHCAFPD